MRGRQFPFCVRIDRLGGSLSPTVAFCNRALRAKLLSARVFLCISMSLSVFSPRAFYICQLTMLTASAQELIPLIQRKILCCDPFEFLSCFPSKKLAHKNFICVFQRHLTLLKRSDTHHEGSPFSVRRENLNISEQKCQIEARYDKPSCTGK